MIEPRHLVDSFEGRIGKDELEALLLTAVAALQKAGFDATGILACEAISPQIRARAQSHGVRVLLYGRLLPEAA